MGRGKEATVHTKGPSGAGSRAIMNIKKVVFHNPKIIKKNTFFSFQGIFLHKKLPFQTNKQGKNRNFIFKSAHIKKVAFRTVPLSSYKAVFPSELSMDYFKNYYKSINYEGKATKVMRIYPFNCSFAMIILSKNVYLHC